MKIRDMAHTAFDIARHHGFWTDDQKNLYAKLALVHTEVSEAVECLRDSEHDINDVWYREEDGKPEGFVMELADIIIRVGDLAAHEDLAIEQAVEEKMAFNRGRPFKHGRNA